MKKIMVVLIVIFASCKSKNKELHNIQSDSDPKQKAYQGKIIFQNHCTSCHHYSNFKEGFVWPSIQDIKLMKEESREVLIEKLMEDTTHNFIRSKLAQREIENLKYYLVSP